MIDDHTVAWKEVGECVRAATEALDDPDRTIGITTLIDVSADLIEAVRLMHELLCPPSARVEATE